MAPACLELLAASLLVSLALPLELPNILLSNPPCPEMLLRLLPARVLEDLVSVALIYREPGLRVLSGYA
jgi:hypothetical protein